MVNYFACLYEVFPAHLTVHLREKYQKTNRKRKLYYSGPFRRLIVFFRET